MIKTFEQFINENYNEMTTYSLCEEYGAPLFNEVSEALMYKINRGINEGSLVLNANMIEEGLFDTIGKFFKKQGDQMVANQIDNEKDIIRTKKYLRKYADELDGEDVIFQGKEMKSLEAENEVYNRIQKLCDKGLEFCTNLAEKEAKLYKDVNDAMTAANEAIKQFTKDAVEKIKEIIEIAKDKVSAAVLAVTTFCQKMAQYTKDTLVKIGKGITVAATTAVSIACMLGYSVYKGVLTLGDFIAQKAKEAAGIIKDVFEKVKNAVSYWVSETINGVKDMLKKACDAVKDAAKKTYDAIGNAFLSAAAILGQLVSDAKDKISEAYKKFIDVAKDFAEEVKAYISDKWDTVTTWCKNTASAFSEGVKNVWSKIKEKVTNAVGAVKDGIQSIKDAAKAYGEEIKQWNDERKQNDFKAKMKYAIDTWGKDTVGTWLDEL